MLVIGLVIVSSTIISAVGRVGQKASDVASSGTDADALAVGQCLSGVSAFKAAKGKLTAMDCGDPSAVIELASRSTPGTCPDGQSGDASQYSSVPDGTTTYCFILNLRQGRCYTADSAKTPLALDDCAAHRSARVVTHVDGSTDGSVCSTAAKTMVFPSPARVYCLERA